MQKGGKTRDKEPKVEREKLTPEKAKEWMQEMKLSESGKEGGRSTKADPGQPFQLRPRSRKDMISMIQTKFQELVPAGKKLETQLQNASFGYRSLVQEAIAAQEVTDELRKEGLPVPASWMFPSTEKDTDAKYKLMYDGLLKFLSDRVSTQSFEVIIVDVGGDILDTKRSGQRDVCVLKTFQKLYEEEKQKLEGFCSLKIEVYGAGCDMHAPSLAKARVELHHFVTRATSWKRNQDLARAFAHGVFQLQFTKDARKPSRANRCFAQALATYDIVVAEQQVETSICSHLLSNYVRNYLALRPEVAAKQDVVDEVGKEVKKEPKKTLEQLSSCYFIELPLRKRPFYFNEQYPYWIANPNSGIKHYISKAEFYREYTQTDFDSMVAKLREHGWKVPAKVDYNNLQFLSEEEPPTRIEIAE